MKAGWMRLFVVLSAFIVASLQQDDWQKKNVVFKNYRSTERYEYVQPDRFFYSHNGHIVTGTKAEKQFHELFQNVPINGKIFA